MIPYPSSSSGNKYLFEFVTDWMKAAGPPSLAEYENYTRRLGALTDITAPQREVLKEFVRFGELHGFPVDTNKHRDGYVRLERSLDRAYRPETPSLPFTLWITLDYATVTGFVWKKDGMTIGHHDLPRLLWVKQESFSTYQRGVEFIQVITPEGFLSSREVGWVRELEVLQWGLGVTV